MRTNLNGKFRKQIIQKEYWLKKVTDSFRLYHKDGDEETAKCTILRNNHNCKIKSILKQKSNTLLGTAVPYTLFLWKNLQNTSYKFYPEFWERSEHTPISYSCWYVFL